MSDRLFFSLAGLLAVVVIGFALVWPQGLGAPSPGPFRRPLGPVDPEVAAAARAAARKPERARITRPRPPPRKPKRPAPAGAPPAAALPPLRSAPPDFAPGGRP